MEAKDKKPENLEDVLRRALALKEGERPFAWQTRLLATFLAGSMPTSLDIPTGLGKTAVMAVWLVARAAGARVPRRLFYTVDRRAVVDQATEVASGLRDFLEKNLQIKAALGLSGALPISTLRGQHVDNRQWLEDPASPGIIVGTVDMTGSRLLFGGYGISRKMRPYHAGLIGVDSLVVLDEAHLVSPFEKLLRAAAASESGLGPENEQWCSIIPSLKLMTLSATGRGGQRTFGLGEADYKPGTETHRRLTAVKRLNFEALSEGEKLSDALAARAWALTSGGNKDVKVLVYCDKREHAASAKAAVHELEKQTGKEVDCQLFVGGRRVRERDAAAVWLRNRHFLAGSDSKPTRPALVFATSAGEVGIDLDADHIVCDLVTWERMVQRLGRVNRRGKGSATIVVIREPDPKPSKAAANALAKAPTQRDKKEQKAIAAHEDKVEQARALAKPFELLPKRDDGIDVSPAVLHQLRLSADESEKTKEILSKASSPVPLRPGLARPLIESWAMTSLQDHSGRPRVQPWLRGWVDEEPQTTIVWRTHLPIAESGPATSRASIEAFFEAAPPHVSEMLETETWKAMDWLAKRAEQLTKQATDAPDGALASDRPCAFVLEDDGSLRLIQIGNAAPKLGLELLDFRFSRYDKKEQQRRREQLLQQLKDATLVIDARLAGLDDNGLLDDEWNALPRTLDDGQPWPDAVGSEPAIRFRVRSTDSLAPPTYPWRRRLPPLPIACSTEGDREPVKWLVVEKWREDAATADDGSEGREQALDAHQQLVAAKAREIAERLGLPVEYAKLLDLAGRFHDEGKRCEKWQNAFNARPDNRPYAKTEGPINQALLDGYRHEFASLPALEKNAEFKSLPEDMKDLALHLIAAHHGFGRPNISTRGCPDLPPSHLEERARQVARRFARLQRRWGPWGLAWWESLLRAADQQASRAFEAKSEKAPSHG